MQSLTSRDRPVNSGALEPTVSDLGAAAVEHVWGNAHRSMRKGIRTRLYLTRLVGLAVVAMVVPTASYWSVNGPSVVAEALFVAGALLALAGFGGRLWALSHICGRKKRQLVRSGPYSVCRHPLYSCSLVGGLGLAMCTGRLSVVALYLAAAWLLVPLTIRTEEAFLQERFADYADYRREVPALLPQWRLGRDRRAAAGEGPACAEAKLPFDRWAFGRGLTETLAFLSPLALLSLLEHAQGTGALPVLFLLP